MMPGLEVIKLEFILRLRIKRNDWLLADTCPQAANHCALFESETVIKFYNLEAWSKKAYRCPAVHIQAVVYLGNPRCPAALDVRAVS